MFKKGERPKLKWYECKCGNGYRHRGHHRNLCEECSPNYYRDELTKISNLNKRLLLMIDRVQLSGFFMEDGFHVDHIVPIWMGERYDLPVFEMSSVDNMQLISSYDNDFTGKYSKGGRPPEEWFALITGKKWVYSVSGSYLESSSLFEVCEYAGISYVKAASQLMKQASDKIVVGSVTITRA